MSQPPLSILVVDDNKTAATATATLLKREGHQVEALFDGQAAIDQLAFRRYDLVLTDLRMEPVDGLSVVRAARAADPPVDVMVFTAFGSVEVAVEAMRLGAVDFLTKPVTAEQILQRVRQLRPAPSSDLQLVGASEAARLIRERARAISQVRSTVLIIGEPGTGRRHLARWLHAHGLESGRPLLTARPGQHIEEERLVEAGTLLIPGVDDWSQEAQAGLLRMLEPLEVGVPPRIIATASPDIEVKAAQAQMPPELYFRLAVLVVRLLPLRRRPDDIPALLEHFLDRHAKVFGQVASPPSPAQLAQLMSHAWPGNIRELANLAERAVVLGSEAFDMDITPAEADAALPTLARGFNLQAHLEEIERLLLVRAIEQTAGDRPAMSKLLGLERNTLRYKLNKYDLLERT